jgi:outer membrane receptor protein involved in Fe transport
MPNRNWRFALSWQYVGERARPPFDLRAPLASYQLLHTAFTYLGFKNWDVELRVENLADTDYARPSPINQSLPNGEGQYYAPYQNDYPGLPRYIGLKVKYAY